MPGQRKSSPFWVEGAVPGTIVVTAFAMCDLVGPRETEPPQVSTRFAKDGREIAAVRGKMARKTWGFILADYEFDYITRLVSEHTRGKESSARDMVSKLEIYAASSVTRET